VLGVEGVADFNALHSRKHDTHVQLYASNIVAFEGDDLRRLPLSMRKASLNRLLARRPDGIFVEPFEQGEIGPTYSGRLCFFAQGPLRTGKARLGSPPTRFLAYTLELSRLHCGSPGADSRDAHRPSAASCRRSE
jgi:hypothetical protein